MIVIGTLFLALPQFVLEIRLGRSQDIYYCGRYVYAMEIVDTGDGLNEGFVFGSLSSLLFVGQRVVHRIEMVAETVVTDSGHEM